MSQTFVTGGTGFLSQWVIDGLLNKGHKVRTTARSEAKAEPLRKHWSEAAASGQLTVDIVTDLSVPGCLDDHLKGVDYLFAVASVMNFNGMTDLKTELVDVSINMLKSTYSSAIKNGVKKIIFTGSQTCCLDYEKGPTYDHVYTEKDWYRVSYEEAGAMTDAYQSYAAAKALAEQFVWEMHKGQEDKMAITFLHMPWILGPSCVPESSYNLSNDMIKQVANGAQLPDAFPAFVDGRTLADGQIKCMDPATDNKRYLIFDDEFLWHDVVPVINEFYNTNLTVPDRPATYWRDDTSRLAKDTGFKPLQTMKSTVTDICKELKSRA